MKVFDVAWLLIKICWKTKVEMSERRGGGGGAGNLKRPDKKRQEEVTVWRRGETDGSSKGGGEAVWKQSGGGGAPGPSRKKRGLAVRVSPDEAQLTVRTYSALMTGLTTSTRWHYCSAVRGPGPHTHSWPRECVWSQIQRHAHEMLIHAPAITQSITHTHTHTHTHALYTACWYVLWRAARLLLDHNHTGCNQMILVQFWAGVCEGVCVHWASVFVKSIDHMESGHFVCMCVCVCVWSRYYTCCGDLKLHTVM